MYSDIGEALSPVPQPLSWFRPSQIGIERLFIQLPQTSYLFLTALENDFPDLSYVFLYLGRNLKHAAKIFSRFPLIFPMSSLFERSRTLPENPQFMCFFFVSRRREAEI